MGDEVEAGFFGDVFEAAMAVVFEKRVAATNRSDEEVLFAVVIYIRKCRGNTDAVG